MKTKSVYLFRKLAFMLLLSFSVSSVVGQESIEQEKKEAQECIALIETRGDYKDNLSRVDMNMLPVGLKKTFGNMEVTIAVNNAEFYKDHALLSVFAKVKIPDAKDRIFFFGGKGIKFSYDGQLIGDARIALLGDIDIPMDDGNIIFRLKGGYDKKSGIMADITYLDLDCEGFKSLGLAAEVELKNSIFEKVDDEGRIIKNEAVIGRFKTEIENWDKLIAAITLPPFAIKGLDGFIWNLENVVFDFSDIQNDPSINFPQEYATNYLIPGNESLWRGIYAKDISITLPPQFSKSDGKSTSFSAQNMLIDNQGVTGNFISQLSILSFDDGDANGWSFSVDEFRLRLLANTLKEGGFSGQIGLPVSDSTRLAYTAIISENNEYYLEAKTIDNLDFNIFGKAKAQIDKGSYVAFHLEDGKFKPEALLHGRMGVEVQLEKGGKSVAELKGIEFQSLHLQTEAPHFSVKYFGYKGEVALIGFPISVKDIALKANNNDVSLGFDIDLTLMDGTFKGGTRLDLVAEIDQGKSQKFRYKETKISKIHIDAEIGEVLKLHGALDILTDDPTYGDCYMGNINLLFGEQILGGLELGMKGAFGYKDYRYWYLEGMANLPALGIPVAPGLLITGFGGGLTYKMKAGSPSQNSMISYIPDNHYSLGIKAAAYFAVGNESVGKGDACFELAFNQHGGLNFAGLYGNVEFAPEIPGLENIQDKLANKYKDIIKIEENFLGSKTKEALEKTKQSNPSEAGKLYSDKSKIGDGTSGIAASVGIECNFAESSFDATFELYANIAGGLVRGIGERNKAGFGIIHIDPSDWYIHMGTPSNRMGLNMGIGSFSVEAGAYLMAGTQVAEAPGIPVEVASILKESTDDLNYMKDLNAISTGKGFAFGSNLSVSTGDLSFLILYANYKAGLGFDIMLKDYGQAQCQGRDGEIGINGWYANGQAYAYMQGELGAKVNLWFAKGKFPILKADFATLMQAKLPNPSWMRAQIAVNTKVLGCINVNCNFKMTIGDECNIVTPGSSPVDMEMISDLSPISGSNDISVFAVPQATFSTAMEKAFNFCEEDGTEKTYRIKLKEFKLNGGTNVIGRLEWNNQKNAASFYSHEVLPPHKDITATVSVIFEEYKNDKWTIVKTGGQEAVETKTVSFKTSDAPKYIPLENIVYCYPVIDQKHYLKDESQKAYVQLDRGQSYLFPAGMKQSIAITALDGQNDEIPFIYNSTTKCLNFSMPQLQNSMPYNISVQLKNTTIGAIASASTDLNAPSAILLDDAEQGNINIESNKAIAETRIDVGIKVLEYDFATSKHNTLSEKIESIKKVTAEAEVLSSDLLMFRYKVDNMEAFDLSELIGTRHSNNKALILPTATLTDYFYTNRIHPLIYEDYPIRGNVRISNRDVNILGVPPAKALPVSSKYLTDIEAGKFSSYEVTHSFPYRYNLPKEYKCDFVELQSKIINAGGNDKYYQHFATGTFPFISVGNYPATFQYIMPDGTKGSSAEFSFYNFVGK